MTIPSLDIDWVCMGCGEVVLEQHDLTWAPGDRFALQAPRCGECREEAPAGYRQPVMPVLRWNTHPMQGTSQNGP